MRTMAELIATVRRHRQSLLALAMITLVAWVLWSARGALPAFFIGLALVFVLDPAVTRLNRLGMPRWAGVIVMYVALVAVVYAFVAYALPPISRQAREFLDRLPELGAALYEIEQNIERWYEGLPLPAELREMIDRQIVTSGETLVAWLRGLVAPTINALVGAAAFLLGLIVVPVWLFFVLKDRESFTRSVASGMPPTWRADVENVIALLGRLGGRWVRGQLLLGLSIFIATVIGLTALTMAGFTEFGQFTLVLALIAGILEWFPIIGPIVSAIPAILIGATIGLPAVIAVIVLYTAIQQLENHILVPKVMGDAVELNPAVLILALIVGGSLFGIGGAVLAAPTVAAGRDLYRYGFHRFGGQAPADAFDLVIHRHATPPSEEAPPADGPDDAAVDERPQR
jgi:predicted PurR-regulated permease PerM